MVLPFFYLLPPEFPSFSQVETTVRTVKEIQIEKSGDRITIRITGEGFLYNMVRIIAGTLMDIGGGLYRKSS